MNALVERVAAFDVHKDSVLAGVRLQGRDGAASGEAELIHLVCKHPDRSSDSIRRVRMTSA
jgi:hypothetical protein